MFLVFFALKVCHFVTLIENKKTDNLTTYTFKLDTKTQKKI